MRDITDSVVGGVWRRRATTSLDRQGKGEGVQMKNEVTVIDGWIVRDSSSKGKKRLTESGKDAINMRNRMKLSCVREVRENDGQENPRGKPEIE